MKFKFIVLLTLFFYNCNYANSFKIVGYYPSWSIRKKTLLGDISFYPKDIKINFLTHIIYAFIQCDEKGNLQTIGSKNRNLELIKQLIDLKIRKPDLKILVSVGGGNLGESFSSMVSTLSSRKNFTENCIKFCEIYNFDGIDIDWEFPGTKGRIQDKENFTLLIKQLYTAFKKHNPKLILTIAGPAGLHNLKNIELDKIEKNLDWINLMCYNFNGLWQDRAGHLSALYPDTDRAINYYFKNGVSKNKIVLGIPLYGISFLANDLNRKSNGSGSGSIANGIRYFFDIKKNLLKKYKYNFDQKALVPYLTGYNEFISFEDENSIKIKCDYIKKNQLGGTMVWNLSFDLYGEAISSIYNSLNN